MKFVTGKTTKAISYQTIAEGGLNNQSVTVHGAVHALRDMGGITFLTLRMADGAIQCVCNPQVLSDGLCEECTVELSGLVRSESRAPGGWEIGVEKITVLSSPAAPMPVSWPSENWISAWTLSCPCVRWSSGTCAAGRCSSSRRGWPRPSGTI